MLSPPAEDEAEAEGGHARDSPPAAMMARIAIGRVDSTDSLPARERRASARAVHARASTLAADEGVISVARTTSQSSIDSLNKRAREVFTANTDSDSDTDSQESGDTAERERCAHV